ncbi:unnamed protein product, partial [Urochloa humidicola]
AAPPTLLLSQPPGDPRAPGRRLRASRPPASASFEPRAARDGPPPLLAGEESPDCSIPPPPMPCSIPASRATSARPGCRQGRVVAVAPPDFRRGRSFSCGGHVGAVLAALSLACRRCATPASSYKAGEGRRDGGRRGRRTAGRASRRRCCREMGREGRERGVNGEAGDLRARPKRRLQCRSGSLIRLHPHRPTGACGDGRHLPRLLLATSGPAPSMGCSGSLIRLPPHRLTDACGDGRHLLRLLLAVYHPRISTTSTRA